MVLMVGLAAHSSSHAGIGMHIETGRFDSITQPYDTVYVNNPVPIRTTFAMSLVASDIGPQKFTYDVYYGVMLPDKTVVSWLPAKNPELSSFELALGLLPLVKNASLYLGTQPAEVLAAAVAAGHVFTPADPLGEYLIFCIVTRPGKDPSDVRNWAGYGSKILTVK